MRVPQGMYVPASQRGKVLRLVRSVYGLKQASQCWNGLIDTFLVEECSMTKCDSDPCLYVHRTKEDKLTILVLYVDDLYIVTEDTDAWDNMREQLCNRFDMTKSVGDWLLGISVEVCSTYTRLSQRAYITAVLDKFNMLDCTAVDVPMSPHSVLESAKNGVEMHEDVGMYASLVGCLSYAANCTRPDIAFAVNQLSQHLQSPTHAHCTGMLQNVSSDI